MSQKNQNFDNIDKTQWRKEGFLLQMAPDRYLLGAGPFYVSNTRPPDQWSLFRPLFFSSECSGKGENFYWYVPSNTVFYSKQELLAFLEDQTIKQNINSWNWQEPCFFQFREFFLKVKKQIQAGKIQKVVPACFETADYSLKEKDISTLIYLLISGSNNGTAYAWWSGGQAIIGITPEYLFRKEGSYIQTMALAGTARNSQHNLLADPKETEEHQLVVETIKNLLSSLGKYHVSNTYIYSLGDIRHLRTDFKLKLKKNISCRRLCQILHPTPALGGLPRKEALELLTMFHQKTHLRYGFGAPFGVAVNEKAFCIVAIRNIQFIDGKAYLGSGCGLVQASQLEREWEELKKKRLFTWNRFCGEYKKTN